MIHPRGTWAITVAGCLLLAGAAAPSPSEAVPVVRSTVTQGQNAGVVLEENQTLTGPAVVIGPIQLANGVTLSNVDIQSTGGPGILGDGVRNVTFDNVSVSADGGAALSITNSTISGNFARLESNNSPGDGIFLQNVDGTFSVTGPTIARNAARNGVGIEFSGAAITFTDVEVEGTGDTGIRLLGTTNPIVVTGGVVVNGTGGIPPGRTLGPGQEVRQFSPSLTAPILEGQELSPLTVGLGGAGAGISLQATDGPVDIQGATIVGNTATNGIEIAGSGGTVTFAETRVANSGHSGIDLLGVQSPKMSFESIDVASNGAGPGMSIQDVAEFEVGQGGTRVQTAGNSGIDIVNSNASFGFGGLTVDTGGSGSPMRFSGSGVVQSPGPTTLNGVAGGTALTGAQLGSVEPLQDSTFRYQFEQQIIDSTDSFVPPPEGVVPVYYIRGSDNTDGDMLQRGDQRELAAAQFQGPQVVSAVTPGPAGSFLDVLYEPVDNTNSRRSNEDLSLALQTVLPFVPGPAGDILVAYDRVVDNTNIDDPGDLSLRNLLFDPVSEPDDFISVPDGRDATVQLMIVVEIKLTAPGRDFVPPPPPPAPPSLFSAIRRVFSFRGLNASAQPGNAVWRSSTSAPLRPVAWTASPRASPVTPGSSALGGGGTQSNPFQMFLTNVGNSTGEAFTGHFLNGGDEPMDIDVKGLVVEPLKEEAQKFVQQQLQNILPENPLQASLDAYCLEFLRLPPQAEQMFQLAPKQLQDQFAPIRDLLDVSKQLNSLGLLPADSDPASYFHAINQWAIWSKEEGFSLDSFADAFVDHTRKQVEAAGNQWTSQFDEVLRGAAPARWANITRILETAASR